ncbi:UbiX family flavin prenyltransferase [Betaproteobacteria bacterium PRO7]|nr:UbiX family flavin prenyltransferase [Betaproteobacteria bacterium PRO7]
MRRIIVAITGASGAVYGVRLLHALRAAADVETHLLVTPAGVLNLKQELDLTRGDVERFADVVHNVRDIGATIASGSFVTHGMVVAPCSMKTLAAIAHGLADNLIARAADVCLKERRRLVLLVREAPLNLAHIRNMEAVTLMGGVIFPPLPAFYHRPKTIDELVDHTVARVLDLLDIAHSLAPRWEGEIGASAGETD